MGRKVFSQPRNAKIIEEITHFVNFLEEYANREIGEEKVKKEFEGKYCRCGIAIVAKSFMTELGDIIPYVNYIGLLIDRNIESIYLIGPATEKNQDFIERISLEIQTKHGYLEYYSKQFKGKIKSAGKRREVSTYLVLLRSPKIIDFYDKELEAQLFDERVEPQKVD